MDLKFIRKPEMNESFAFIFSVAIGAVLEVDDHPDDAKDQPEYQGDDFKWTEISSNNEQRIGHRHEN
jgi:hypothetical protein